MAKPVGYLKRQKRMRKAGKVTVRYADGTSKVVKPGEFQHSRKPKRPRRRTRYQRYLQSEHWRELRHKALERDKYRCTACGRLEWQLSGSWLEVHHLTYERFGREDLADLVTVCKDCHRSHHHGLRPLSG